MMRTSTPANMIRNAAALVVLFGAGLMIGAASLFAQAIAEPPVETKPNAKVASSEGAYLRIDKTDAEKPRALQTAIVRYVGKPNTPYAGRIVDLVGVVHIGQHEYYAALNKRLATYDSVLYELVAPDGTRIRPEDLAKRRSILSSMQSGMKDMLGLEYQLEKIDYMAKNFRHADMSPEEFVEDLSRRGDSVWKMAARMMGAGLASQAATGGEAGMLLAWFSDDRAKHMKQMMSQQLIDVDAVTAGLDDANGENTLIKGRNAKCFEILKEELDAGKKKVSVFYGAGHLPDMAERLENDFLMKEKKTSWLDAWDLTRN
ncbi:hypothetical protein Pla52o_20930 [Novipirellula galeiformis]|uniref:TraB family protein n=2 Tax=Novipirellula galeiformis TaxID=2528004 RepID=A0A5C6CMZ4_9BACT|nr:hypothetical protein [Novipirellula galeiformis]TWU24169.1 hypothetical protein Pla52o_20930 [Novipirellula galeiformis]